MAEEKTTDAGSTEEKRTSRKKSRVRWLEILSAILLALAAIASAWCAYQSARWNGVGTDKQFEASKGRYNSIECNNMATQEMAIDTEEFSQYIEACFRNDQRAADYYQENFRDEFRVAFEAWKKTDPFVNPDSPTTPLDMEEYEVRHLDRLLYWREYSENEAKTAKKAMDDSDKYLLLTVLFASVLFFAGVCTKFTSVTISFFTLGIGAILFLGSAFFLIILPVY